MVANRQMGSYSLPTSPLKWAFCLSSRGFQPTASMQGLGLLFPPFHRRSQDIRSDSFFLGSNPDMTNAIFPPDCLIA